MRFPFSSFPALLALALMLGGVGTLRADEALRRVQQSLRDQGFYYGPIDGSPGDETTQAIRRYQIRNGLAVTGALNDETRNAIAKAGGTANTVPRATATPTIRSTPPPLAPPARERPGNNSDQPDYRIAPREAARPPANIRGNTDDNADDDEETTTAPTGPSYSAPQSRPDLRVPPSSSYGTADSSSARYSAAPSPALSALFEHSPYEFAPPPVQADVVRRAQSYLLHAGFYDGETDGVPGLQTAEAIANFQEVNRLRRSARLDGNTLAAMRLLPVRRQVSSPRYYAPRPGGVYEGRIVPPGY